MRKQRALLAGVLAMSLGGVALGSPLLTLQIEGSLTGAAGTYSSDLVAAPGQTIFYEVNALFNNGAINSNTANVPNGTTDSIDSLPSFQLTANNGAGPLSNGTMQGGFGVGSGAGVTQPNGANTAVIRAVNSPGVYVNADTPLTLETGQLTVGTASKQQVVGAYFSTSGLTKVAGALTTATGTTETSADPMIAYAPLTVSTVPEPASLAVFSLAAVGLLRRRRNVAQ